MFRQLAGLILILLPIQTVILVSGIVDNYGYSLQVPFFVTTIFFLMNLVIFFPIYNRFENIEKPIFLRIDFSRREKIIVASLFLMAFAYNAVLLSRFDAKGMLNHIQGQSGLGLAFRLSTVIVPALFALTVLAFRSSGTKIFIFSLLVLAISVENSQSMLTKGPLVSVIMVFIYMIRAKIISRYVFLGFFIIVLISLWWVYIGRGDETLTGKDSAFLAVIFRLPLILEGAQVFDYVIDHGSLEAKTPEGILAEVTWRIFGQDPRFTGVAPSYLGFFLSWLGVLGFFIALLFPLFVAWITRLLTEEGPLKTIRLLFYFVWFFELMSFFIDGNPAFYYGTTDNIMFWFLFLVTFLFTLLRVFHKRALVP